MWTDFMAFKIYKQHNNGAPVLQRAMMTFTSYTEGFSRPHTVYDSVLVPILNESGKHELFSIVANEPCETQPFITNPMDIAHFL
jgi:hypothetical protein